MIKTNDPRRHRLLRLTIDLGDNLYRRGLYVEAHRHYSIALSLVGPRREIVVRVDNCRRYLPPPPAYASSPPLWGEETHVRALFADGDVELQFERGTTPFRFASAEHYVSFFETNYGPTVKARERLTAQGRWDECRAEIVEMMERRNVATDGSLEVASEYLIAVARKRR